MLLYKYRYALFFSCIIAELMTWLCLLFPAGLFFDAVPDFVFTIFLVAHYGSPFIFILYWTGLWYKYRRVAFSRADRWGFAVSVVVFLPKLILFTALLIDIYGD